MEREDQKSCSPTTYEDGMGEGALEDSIFRKPGLEDPRQTESSDTSGFSDFPGAISWGTATPMDVVKSRIQADGVYLNKYRGVVDCISQSYQQEGFKVSCTQPPWVSSSLAEGEAAAGEARGGYWESRC